MALVSEIKSEISGVRTIHLIGDAPNLGKNPRRRDNSVVIALNRAFLKFDCDYVFFACRKFVQNYQKDFDLEKKAIHPKQFETFGFDAEYTYNPVWDIDKNIYNNRLRAGHSVLIPALHLACLLHPQVVILHGIELKYFNHWYDKNTEKRKRFPARSKICRAVKYITEAFKNTLVLSDSKDSLLVALKIVKVA